MNGGPAFIDETPRDGAGWVRRAGGGAARPLYQSRGNLWASRALDSLGIFNGRTLAMKLASGIAPVTRMLALNLAVGLGPDGPAGAALEMATLGNARALGLEREIGSLEAGKRADLITVRLDRAHAVSLSDVYSQLVYALKGSDVRDVMVNGKPLVRDRRAPGGLEFATSVGPPSSAYQRDGVPPTNLFCGAPPPALDEQPR
jgi:hypothetical protein